MSSAAAGSPDTFVGRSDELQRVLSTCTAVRRRHGALVAVSGPSGIGKTRFCRELARRVDRSGLAVVMVRCWVGGGAPALWPWQPVLSELCGPDATELLAADTGSLNVDPDRFVRFQTITEQLADSCGAEPACLIIDDIHAADAGTLLLTRFVARSLEQLSLALVVVRRSNEPEPDRPERALLDEMEQDAVPVVLHPFDLDETTTFFRALGMGGIEPDFAEVLRRTTGGNPLFLRRIAALGPPDPRHTPPTSLRATLDQALARLAPVTRQVLRASSVLGSSPAVTEVVDLVPSADPVTVLEARQEAAGAGLVATDPADRFTFGHELIRAALEDSMGTALRLDLHARAAALIGTDVPGASSERLARRAHHALTAAQRSPEDARLAVAACREAARSMSRSFAYEQADELLSAAVALHDPPGLGAPSADLLVEWAQAALVRGQLSEARRRFDRAAAAAEHGPPNIFAEATLGMGGHWVDERRTPVERARVLGLQRLALAGLDRRDPRQATLSCRLRTRLAAEAAYDGEPADAVRAALAEARTCGDHEALAEALSLTHYALLTPEHLAERLSLADELVQVASESGLGLLALMGLCWRSVDLFHLGDRRALRALEDLRERAGALACESILYIVEAMDVMLVTRAGRLEEAEARAEHCYDTGMRVGDVDALGYFGAHLLTIRWIQGRDAELLDLAGQVTGSPTLVAAEFAFRVSAAAIAARSGSLAEARATLDGLDTDGLAALPQSSTWLAGMNGIVEVADVVGDTRRAREAYDLLLPYADLPIMPSLAVVCLGSAQRPLGVAARTFGELDRAVDHLDRAVDADERLGNRPVAAISRAELARTLARRDRPGDRQRAVLLTNEATAAAVTMGMDRRAESWRSTRPDPTTPDRRGTVCQEVWGWTVTLDGRATLVPDLLGMRYLAELLTHPGQPLSAVELVGAASGGPVTPGGSSQEILDEEARAAYAARAVELGQELTEAEAAADIGRAEQLRSEMDALAAEVESALGLGGRSRAFTDLSERARTAVRKALLRAIHRIGTGDRELGEMLERSISTGAVCTYTPDPRSPVRWRYQRPRG